MPDLPPWRPEGWEKLALRTRLRRTVRAYVVVGLAVLIGMLPFGFACAVGRGLGALAFRLSASLRRVILENLAQAFPDRDEAWQWRTGLESMRSFGLTVIELTQNRYVDRHIRDLVEYPPECACVFDEALARGRGVVTATGHIGSWEIGVRRVVAHGQPAVAVAREQNAPPLTRWIDRSRRRSGMGIVWRRPHQPVADEIERVLRANAIVGLLCDQDASVRSVFVPFFGRPAATPRGPGELVLRTGATLVAGWCHRVPGGRHRLTIERVPLPAPTGDRERDVTAIVAAATAALERAIREAPEQWVWFHRRWKTRPPGEAAQAAAEPTGGKAA